MGHEEAPGCSGVSALKKQAADNTGCDEPDTEFNVRNLTSYAFESPVRLGKFLAFHTTLYTEGGVHPIESSASVIFDTQTGEAVDLLRYLKPNMGPALSKLANQQVHDEAEDPSMITEEADVTSALIYPSGDGAEIMFNPYDVAPYAAGYVSTQIKKKQLGKYFQSNEDTHVLFGLGQ